MPGATRATTGCLVIGIKPSAILLIDSSNFYHSLKEQNDLPFDAEQFALLVKELNKKFDLKKINFYDAMKNRAKDPIGYSKQQRFHSRLRKAIPNIEIKHLKLRYVRSISKEEAFKISKEIGIPSNLKDKLYLFLKKLGVVKLTREKGLDVLIVIDALEAHRSGKYDNIILLSGDSDFVPAVKFMQNDGAKVINLHAYSGSSNELRETCSSHILIDIDANGSVNLKSYKT